MVAGIQLQHRTFILCLCALVVMAGASCARRKHEPVAHRPRPDQRQVEALFQRVRQGQAAELLQELKRKPRDVTATDSHGNTLLHEAIARGNHDLAQGLLKLGITHSARNRYGETPLHLATKNQRLACTQLLLRSGSAVDLQDAAGKTPLIGAIYCGQSSQNYAIMRALLHAGANPNLHDKEGYSAMSWAVECGDVNAVRMFVQRGGYTEGSLYRLGISITDSDDPSEAMATLRFLLDSGVDANQAGERGQTILHLAASAPYRPALLRLLLTKHADPNARDEAGQTPLHCAASVGNIAAIRTLVAHGADRSIRDNNNAPPFSTALQNGYREAAGLLEY